MKLGTGSRWWIFEARITNNVGTNTRSRGFTPTMAQDLYAGLTSVLSQTTPEKVLAAMEAYRDQVRATYTELECAVQDNKAVI